MSRNVEEGSYVNVTETTAQHLSDVHVYEKPERVGDREESVYITPTTNMTTTEPANNKTVRYKHVAIVTTVVSVVLLCVVVYLSSIILRQPNIDNTNDVTTTLVVPSRRQSEVSTPNINNNVITAMMLTTISTLTTITTGYQIYHHCYQEGSYCGKKNIACYNNTVIDIMWSRVGYSEYWILDGTRTNCSVTDEKCEMEIDEPSKNCSGLPVCQLYTCSNSSNQLVKCDSNKATNYMRINYTCIKVI